MMNPSQPPLSSENLADNMRLLGITPDNVDHWRDKQYVQIALTRSAGMLNIFVLDALARITDEHPWDLIRPNLGSGTWRRLDPPDAPYSDEAYALGHSIVANAEYYLDRDTDYWTVNIPNHWGAASLSFADASSAKAHIERVLFRKFNLEDTAACPQLTINPEGSACS